MSKSSTILVRLLVVVFVASVACRVSPTTDSISPGQTQTNDLMETPSPESSPIPSRLLTICMGREPASLFLYGDSSIVARSIRQAIYDGPVDFVNNSFSTVILANIPSVVNGDVSFEPINVQVGNSIVDGSGNLTILGEGTTYLPIGCEDASCGMVYSGQDAIQMEQMLVKYKLRSDILWSDGVQLTADDSVYSFEVAQNLYPMARAEVIAHTDSYRAIDQFTAVWRGVPGFRDSDYIGNFFIPLPRHTWGGFSPQELLSTDVSHRAPLGWGPYIIQEWTSGDHITLNRNPNYFRSNEDLPKFDQLVFRFVPDAQQAIAALLAGECDYLDETTNLELHIPTLVELQNNRRAKIFFKTGSAWEHIDFGINSLNSALIPFFQLKETRQAIALCTDRQKIVDELFLGNTVAPDSFSFPGNPLTNPQVRRYPFDPQAGIALLDSVGWMDNDGDPGTPRVAQGVPGVTDGTQFEITFLTTSEEEKQRAAQIIHDSLAQCGIKVNIASDTWDVLFAPGPEGAVFGRNFTLAQFGWISSMQPPCSLYTSAEIPGPYPDYPRGWSGANVSGYSNPEYDRYCQQAMTNLPDSPEFQTAHFQAQAIYAEELPSLPLYGRLQVVATRPDFCNVKNDPYGESLLWNLENFNYGEGCSQ
jgi:peptide/nickel transport system substrate-binding protein